VDLVFQGAQVADGTGNSIARDDVGVTGAHISSVTEAGSLAGRRSIDATDLVLAPGFIDMHSHSDLQILAQPDYSAKVSQG
jgi:N-acyl-D-amino-acid deacylase